jgi:hypothetical protein
MLPIVELQSLQMSFRLRMGITRQIFHPSILLDNALSTKPIHLYNHLAHIAFRYAKLGLMGVTVIFSSGDNGVAGEQS